VAICPNCAQENPAIARFCLACGGGLAPDGSGPREERRIVTVIFVDLVEFTSRAERLDPEDVRGILAPYHERVRSEIESFGGVVEKFIGDAVVGVFGAPIAFGDDPERAVRAALAVREAIHETNADDRTLQLRVRMALNTGEALVTLGARPERGEAMVAGDVINTASRLQQAAPTGGIVVGEETYRCTCEEIRYEQMEAVAAKGKSTPVEVWLAIEPLRPVSERGHAGSPLIGRSKELELLRGIWDRVLDANTPHLVTVFGPAGVGKTRLGSEFTRVVSEMGGRAVRGRCLPYRESSAYGAFAVQVKQLAGIFESDAADVGLHKLRTTVQTLGAVDTDAVSRSLAILLGLDPGSSVADRETLFFSIRCFIEAVARDQPTMLVFEDIHWADSSLLDLIELLAARLHELPVLMLTLSRPELLDQRPGWGGGLPAYNALQLHPLAEADALEMATGLLARLGEDQQRKRAAELALRAEGNPLFIEQLTAVVSEQLTELAGPLPTTIRGIVTARLDALPPAERSLLLDAAVVGKVFWRGALMEAADDQERLSQLLSALEQRDLIRRETVSAIEGDHQFAFKHVLIRDIAYEMLPRAHRRQRHAQVATFLEQQTDEFGEAAAQLARHWREAGRGERAVQYFTLAAEHAGRGWAKERAVTLYREALQLVPESDPELRRELRRRLTLAYWSGFHVPDLPVTQRPQPTD
jgi:class 3 adenylate cyclase